MYIAIIIYTVGYWLAFLMQRTEVAAGDESYTFGTRLLISATSLLSWLMVLIVLVNAWVKSLGQFWSVPIEKTKSSKEMAKVA